MKQEQALKMMKSGKNVFLTGCAGAGKTHVLNEFISYLKRKRIGVAVTASTGVAATHLNGVTIHSFTGMGVLDELTRSDLSDILRKSYLKKKILKTRVLIIDEISMLATNQLDIADQILRAFLKNKKPFGGMQVVLCGDFFQLPPVKKSMGLYDEGADFAYKGRAWSELNLKICYLSEQYRHKEQDLLKVLSAIREGGVNQEVMNLLRGRYRAKMSEEQEVTKLYTHNVDVDRINNEHLKSIPGDEKKVFNMKKRGRMGLADTIGRNLLAPERLELRKGAVVMFVKNNFEEGYVNGTLGKIISLKGGTPTVKTISGKTIRVAPEKWVVDDGFEKIAEVEQIPLRLAWAVTVHKSQGTTLDAAEIDLSKSFEEGMGYVAFSRLRSLQGVRLMGLNEKALQVSEEVQQMDKYFREESEKLAKK